MKVQIRNKMVIFAVVIVILIGIILIYWNIPYSPYKTSFNKDIKSRIDEVVANEAICTQDEIDRLPEAMRRHCEYIGLVGSKKYNVVNVLFHNTKFVFDSNKGTILDMDYDLWLLCDKPYRSALCKSSIFGIPFDGMDYCTDDKVGGMKGMIGKAIEIFDVHNEQMYKAGMISWLAEGAGFNPCILLSDYVTYEEIDSTHVKAMISYNGVEGTGIFTFDEQGRLLDFESDERQVEELNGIMTPIGWRARYGDYIEKDGLLIPGMTKVIKVYSDKEVVYFDSNNIDLYYYK
jgi:hypothetical protein